MSESGGPGSVLELVHAEEDAHLKEALDVYTEQHEDQFSSKEDSKDDSSERWTKECFFHLPKEDNDKTIHYVNRWSMGDKCYDQHRVKLFKKWRNTQCDSIILQNLILYWVSRRTKWKNWVYSDNLADEPNIATLQNQTFSSTRCFDNGIMKSKCTETSCILKHLKSTITIRRVRKVFFCFKLWFGFH